MKTIAEAVAHNAAIQPTGIAFIEACTGEALSWRDYNERAQSFVPRLCTVQRGTRLALQIDRGIDMHIAMLACELAGIVGVGIGARAGASEVTHLTLTTDAMAIVTTLDELAEIGIADTPAPGPVRRDTDAVSGSRPFDDLELWFLNSTSGTTGLPKCVMHHQRRWFAFHELAQRAGQLTSADVFMSLLPAPFGFGLWTAHFTPTILGAPCVILDKFNAAIAADAIAKFAVSVMAAVSTQFVMMLNDVTLRSVNSTSMRVLFTGGEMVPPTRAQEWEQLTGSRVLQFYGSNETGALSNTNLLDEESVRLFSAGHIITDLNVRLFDPETGADVTATGGPGIAACRGEVNCLGYFNDLAANQELFTADGWMRTGDLCTIDDAGVLTVAGRASDFIIRGGKNISAAVIEQACSSMRGVTLAAAVAKPDATFGERVCVFCVITKTAASFSLDDLRHHLHDAGVGKEYWPEYLVIHTEDLPRSSGGKVAKSDLRRVANALPPLRH